MTVNAPPATPTATAPPATRRPALAGTPRRRLVADRLARWVVTAGGLSIIASVLGILLFILAEVAPLLRGARVEAAGTIPGSGKAVGALLVDEHRSHAVTLDADGSVTARRLADGAVVTERDLAGLLAEAAGTEPAGEAAAGTTAATGTAAAGSGPQATAVGAAADGNALAIATNDGRLVVLPVAFRVSFDGSDRVVTPELGEPVALVVDPGGRAVGPFAIRRDDDGSVVAAAVLTGDEVAVVRHAVREDFSGETTVETTRLVTAAAPEPVTALALDLAGGQLVAGTARGSLLSWRVGDDAIGPPEAAAAGAPITALAFLIGDRSLVVGQASGTLSVWFPVGEDGAETKSLTRIREFPGFDAAVATIAPSWRDKGFLAGSARGTVGLFHSTAHRTLWTGRPAESPVSALAMTPKGDGALVAASEGMVALDIDNPHPEMSLRTLFSKIWYEGYDAPAYVWQSTGGTDDFEPKLSLVPLLLGTLKGTLYSLVLAVPLAIFGAMYLSQFMHPTYKRLVKPMIEIMAALPSVVLGFLAGLWLAPRIERAVPGVFLMILVLPLVTILSGLLWSALPRRLRGRFPSGTEAFVFLVTLTGGLWFCFEASGWIENAIFAGSFPQWLHDAAGFDYDQRNALVVGLAMGFAVIPIIFAITEDAFSNVPRNLVAGSLALGANRWQTVTRVVLPTASPGIFSAVMVGFGRAVGETMIVLMATGNTPILEWNPFNGFRTLSANIAVEIPEAPVDSTLYRTLFLAALLLFVLTFAVNTVAELVRQRLRRRYAAL